MEIIKKVKKLVEPHELIYLTEFGSTLYGLNSESSDLDLKGIFLPTKESLLVGETTKSFKYSSGDDKSKNSSDDVDIQLFSLHYFLQMLQKGETGAIDLLFSMNKANKNNCIKYMYSPLYYDLFLKRDKFINPKNTKAYYGYAMGQAKKYGLKGTRVGIIKSVKDYLIDNGLDCLGESQQKRIKLSYCINDIDKKFHDDSYCFQKDSNGVNSLVLCGRVHQETISIKEFATRINDDWKKYGERAKLAMKNEGLDFKALSHACRCCVQMEELLETGCIVFPLKDKEMLKDIKYGKYTWPDIEKILLSYLDRVAIACNNCKLDWEYDHKTVKNFILSFYN